MTASRRKFLILAATGVSAVTLAALVAQYQMGERGPELAETPGQGPTGVARGGPTSAPLQTPSPASMSTPTRASSPTPAPALTAAPERATNTPAAAAARPSSAPALSEHLRRRQRSVLAWLRMIQVREVPTSEAAYSGNLDLIDVAMPLNGGSLQADGEWMQEGHKVLDDWPVKLPKQARDAGQLYMPGVGNDREGLLTILEQPRLQDYAVARLIELATEERGDAPWDGIYLDLEGGPYDYRSEMSGFLYRIARAVKDTGLLLGISVGGVTQQGSGTPTQDDAVDLGVAGELGDYVDLRCYDYIGPPPRSIAPNWWIEACIEYALKKGVRPEQMTVGLATFSQYWPDSKARASEQMTYDQAMRLIEQGGTKVEWIERNEGGVVLESYAKLGEGHLWLSTERSYQHGLNLIDKYGLLGNTIFTPGMGNAEQWDTIKAWRNS